MVLSTVDVHQSLVVVRMVCYNSLLLFVGVPILRKEKKKTKRSNTEPRRRGKSYPPKPFYIFYSFFVLLVLYFLYVIRSGQLPGLFSFSFSVFFDFSSTITEIPGIVRILYFLLYIGHFTQDLYTNFFSTILLPVPGFQPNEILVCNVLSTHRTLAISPVPRSP